MKRLFNRQTKWIWLPRPSSRRRNTYVCFRRSFSIKGPVRSGELRITADSRYEVYINGHWLGHGPIRAFPSLWPVDIYDVRHLLKPGKNVIAVLVHHFGISTFQYLPAEAGLIAELEYKDSAARKIATDGSWKCIEHEGYAYAVPRISCQQGWEEQFDARVEPGTPEKWTALEFKDTKWKSARALARPPHPKLEERDIPFFTREVAEPIAVRAIEAVQCAPYSFNLNPRAYINAMDLSSNHFRGNMLLASWIDSPIEQDIQLHPPHGRPNVQWKLNGQLLKFADRSLQRTDTGVAHAQLKPGRNLLLAALPTTEHLWWAILNLWTDHPITFSSSPNAKSKIPFLAFGPFRSNKPHVFDTIAIDPDTDYPGATQERYLTAWERGDLTEDDLAQPFSRPLQQYMVANADVYATCASERPVSNAQAPRIDNPTALLHDNADWTTIYPIPPQDSRKKTPSVRLLIDFGRELVGYHELEIDAEAGTIIDDHNFEFIQRDGRFNLAEGMNNSFRYICRQGVQRYRTFIRRGFRYSWLSFRNFKRPIRVRFVRAILSTYPQTHAGEFACSDDKLTAIWNVGVHSVRCCSEDTYTDCPTYEQTFWVGDARNEAMVDLVANGDPRLSAHSLRLAGRSLERSPIIESQVPSGWQNLLPTWSFLWMRWGQEHFQFTGDVDFAKEMLDKVQGNVRGIQNHLNDLGLFQMHAWNLFDWAGMDTPAGGIVTHINCFAVLGLRQCAELAEQLGQLERAQQWKTLANEIALAVNRHLWSDARQAYVDCIRADGSLSPVFSQQTQTAAYIAGVAQEDRAKRCSEILYHPPEGFITTGSPFFMFFLLEALVRENRFDELIQTIGSYWGQQIDAGATTFWEMFHPGQERLTRSHCHGWSAAPVVFLTQYVLGVRPQSPGYQQILIAPHPGPLAWADGKVPTPDGVVHCYWQSSANRFELRVSSPAGREMRIELPFAGHVEIHKGRAVPVGATSPQVLIAVGSPALHLSVTRQ